MKSESGCKYTKQEKKLEMRLKSDLREYEEGTVPLGMIPVRL